jgi:hypothetical protein
MLTKKVNGKEDYQEVGEVKKIKEKKEKFKY